MTGVGLFFAALSTEARKVASARVAVATAIMLDAGIAVMCAAAVYAAGSADPAAAAKLGPVLAQGGWTGFLAGGTQITAVAGLLGFGVVLAWMFGREFSDGTVTGLFALPVSRPTLAAAKLVVYGCWAAAVSTGLVVMLLVLGLASGLGLPGSGDWALLGRAYAIALLTATLALPAAWAATLGRGLLAGIATMIGIVVAAQVAVFTGLGGWFPFAAPGLWAAATGTTAGSVPPVSGLQLALVAPMGLLVIAATLTTWRRLELDR